METSTGRTIETLRRYDRQASLYDMREAPMELLFRRWRQRLWSQVPAGSRVLEIGAGTGKNLPFYPPGGEVVAFDLSPEMLGRYVRRHITAQTRPSLLLMDAQELAFRDASFDVAVGTFVFCSVPDPVQSLREVRRVLKPGGRLVLLEHVLSELPVLRFSMNQLNSGSVRLTGANINRDTVRNVQRAGFTVLEERKLLLDVVKLIVASGSS